MSLAKTLGGILGAVVTLEVLNFGMKEIDKALEDKEILKDTEPIFLP